MLQQVIDSNFEKARKRKIKEGNSGLPAGAIKCTDEEVQKLLEKTRIKEIEFYNRTQQCVHAERFALKDYAIEESSSDCRTFNEQLNPLVEGYLWYRGFAVRVLGGKVFLFYGWMLPWLEGGAPDSVIYFSGNVTKKTILEVANAYFSGISYIIDREIYDKKRDDGLED